MAKTLNERLFELFGEAAPIAPRNKEQFEALPLTQRETIRRAMPDVVQSFCANPDQLPAAVALRRDRHELTIADVPALQKAGLTLEANELVERARKCEISKLEEDYKAFKARRDIPLEHQQQYDERARQARIASRNFAGGHY